MRIRSIRINLERQNLELVGRKYSEFKYAQLKKKKRDEDEGKRIGKKKVKVEWRHYRGCHLCRKGMYSRTTNFYQHLHRSHSDEETGVSMPYACSKCDMGLPTKGELVRHQLRCEPTYHLEENIHNALGAADWAQDLTIQTWDWVLPPNSFTAIPKLNDLAKGGLRKGCLKDFKEDRSSAQDTATVLLSAIPDRLVTAIGQEKLENMLENYLRIKFDKNGSVKVKDTEEFPGDGGGSGRGNGIVASRELPAHTIIDGLDAITIPVSKKYQVQVKILICRGRG